MTVKTFIDCTKRWLGGLTFSVGLATSTDVFAAPPTLPFTGEYDAELNVQGDDHAKVSVSRGRGDFEADPNSGAIKGTCKANEKIKIKLSCPVDDGVESCTAKLGERTHTWEGDDEIFFQCPALELTYDPERVTDFEDPGSMGRPRIKVNLQVEANPYDEYRFEFVDQDGVVLAPDDVVDIAVDKTASFISTSDEVSVTGRGTEMVTFDAKSDSAAPQSHCAFKLPKDPTKPLRGRCGNPPRSRQGEVVHLIPVKTSASTYRIRVETKTAIPVPFSLRLYDEFDGTKSWVDYDEAKHGGKQADPTRRYVKVVVNRKPVPVRVRGGYAKFKAAVGQKVKVIPVYPIPDSAKKAIEGEACVFRFEGPGTSLASCTKSPKKVGRPIFLEVPSQMALRLAGKTVLAVGAGPDPGVVGAFWMHHFLIVQAALTGTRMPGGYFEMQPDPSSAVPLQGPASGYLLDHGIDAGIWQVSLHDADGNVATLAQPVGGFLQVECDPVSQIGCAPSEFLQRGKLSSVELRVPVTFHERKSERCWDHFWQLKLTNGEEVPFRACPGGAPRCRQPQKQIIVDVEVTLRDRRVLKFKMPVRLNAVAPSGRPWIWNNEGCDSDGFMCGTFRIPSGAAKVTVTAKSVDFDTTRLNRWLSGLTHEACEMRNDFVIPRLPSTSASAGGSTQP